MKLLYGRISRSPLKFRQKQKSLWLNSPRFIERIYQKNISTQQSKYILTVIETVNKDDHGANLVKNFRNVQPLNGREVTFYSSLEKIVAPMEPEIKSGGDEPVAEEETPSKRQPISYWQ